MKISIALTAAVSLATPPSFVHSFHLTGWNLSTSSSVLYAKSSKPKKKKKAPPPVATGGGFGKQGASSSAATSWPVVHTEEDDYAAFPTLESKVQETILPAQGELLNYHSEGTPLPTEIIHRLDQIYGFCQFNYPEQEKESFSFGDMLATNKQEDAKSDRLRTQQLPASSSSVVDFANLLSLATTEEETVSTETSAVTKEAAAYHLPLSCLPSFSEFRVLHVDPLVLAVDNFFTDAECDRYIRMSEAPAASKNSNAPVMTRSKTVGKDAQAKAQRTSTTWFHHFKEVPELMAKASRLLGLEDITHWEEPQTVRYRRNEKFTWHLDALAPSQDLESLGGQRTATLLVYLTEMSTADGGATVFRDLRDSNGMLRIRPKKGSALLFFPAAGGIPNVPFDIRTLHCGEVVAEDASQDKWIAQMWLREGSYKPTAPPGNTHAAAFDAVSAYCTSCSSSS